MPSGHHSIISQSQALPIATPAPPTHAPSGKKTRDNRLSFHCGPQNFYAWQHFLRLASVSHRPVLVISFGHGWTRHGCRRGMWELLAVDGAEEKGFGPVSSAIIRTQNPSPEDDL